MNTKEIPLDEKKKMLAEAEAQLAALRRESAGQAQGSAVDTGFARVVKGWETPATTESATEPVAAIPVAPTEDKETKRVRKELERILGNVERLKRERGADEGAPEKKQTKEEVIANLRKIIGEIQKKLEQNERRREGNRAMREKLLARLAELENAVEETDTLNAKLREKKAALAGTSRLDLVTRRDLNRRITLLEKREETFKADMEANPFKYYIIDAMSPENFKIIFGKDKSSVSMEEINQVMGETGRDLRMEARETKDDEGRTILQIASNGFYLRMSGTNEGYEIYEIVKPDGQILQTEKKLDLKTSQTLLAQEAQGYLDEEIVLFDKMNKQL